MVDRRISPELLALLRCPASRQPLRCATPEELVRCRIEAALVREDGRVAYPVREGIPVLLAEEAIALDSPAT